ncbi:probable Integrin-linked kinase-associated serine/threonine phosphatase 2C at C-terminar half [Coccomyxa sp. Obi]|nr:probable Integrin-linked kinase-associated serine/threonine phosphatase 2C at C-terminar half [Coccomyxa sp. Obi]
MMERVADSTDAMFTPGNVGTTHLGEGDTSRYKELLMAGAHPGAPSCSYTANTGLHIDGQARDSPAQRGQVGQSLPTQMAYSIGDSIAAAEREQCGRNMPSYAQIPQLIGECGSPSSMAGPSVSLGTTSIGAFSSANPALFSIPAVPVSFPGHVALPGQVIDPGQVIGSITLPVLSMPPYPVAVGEASLGGSPMAVSSLSGSPSISPANSRPIGETGKLRSPGGSGTFVIGCGSNQSSVATGMMDTSTAKIVAQQEETLQAHSAANQQQSPSDPGTSSRLVGTTENHLGGVHGATGLFGHVTQPGDLVAGKKSAPALQLQVFYGGAESRGKREYQQDRHTVIEDLKERGSSVSAAMGVVATEHIGLAAVFDGHKTCEAAELAHKRLPELLSREPQLFNANKGSTRDEVCDVIMRSFKTLDKEILEDAHCSKIKDCQYGGTTALLALCIGQVLYVAHTGDSGAVMACTSFDVNFPLRLTSDHKPNRPDEHARIQDAGGNIDERHDRVVSDPKPHNNRITLLNMSRSLGDPQFKRGKGEPQVECEPEVRRVELQPADVALVLGSDGLWDKMSDTTAVAIVNKVKGKSQSLSNGTAKDAAQALVDEALKRGTKDNITAVVMLFNWT